MGRKAAIAHSPPKKKEEEQSKGNEDKVDGPCTKCPWYKKTTRKGPKGNKAHDTFIATCREDFINLKNRHDKRKEGNN